MRPSEFVTTANLNHHCPKRRADTNLPQSWNESTIELLVQTRLWSDTALRQCCVASLHTHCPMPTSRALFRRRETRTPLCSKIHSLSYRVSPPILVAISHDLQRRRCQHQIIHIPVPMSWIRTHFLGPPPQFLARRGESATFPRRLASRVWAPCSSPDAPQGTVFRRTRLIMRHACCPSHQPSTSGRHKTVVGCVGSRPCRRS